MMARIAERVAAASPVWAESVRPDGARDEAPLFGPLAGHGLAEGVETIYEGYLVHHAEGRIMRAPDRERALLLGDYLYAAGLVEVCRAGDVDAVATLASLVSLVSHLRAEGGDPADDGRAWLAAARHLGGHRGGDYAAAIEALRHHDVEALRRLVPGDDGDGAVLRRHVRLLADRGGDGT
jgi:hypothetical protein